MTLEPSSTLAPGAPAWGPRWLFPAMALVALAFGLMTLRQGGAVLLGDAAARAAAGQVVPFVLVFNTGAGVAYVVAALGLWRRRPWGLWLALAIAVGSAGVLAALGLHIVQGGAYETRTLAAMVLRTLVWATISALAWRGLRRVPGA